MKMPTILSLADTVVIRHAKAEIEIERRRRGHVRHQHLIMIHPQRACALVGVGLGLRAQLRRHARDKFERRSGPVVDVQRAALERHIDEPRRTPARSKCAFALSRSLSVEDPKPDALANRLAPGLLQGEAVMTALLDAVQPDRLVVLVADIETDHLGVERPARGEIARREHEMARAGDVERRLEVGLRQAHNKSPHLSPEKVDRSSFARDGIGPRAPRPLATPCPEQR